MDVKKKMDELKSLLAEALASGEVSATDLHELVTSVRKELKAQGKLPKIQRQITLSPEAQKKKAERRLKTIAKEIKKIRAQIRRANKKVKKWRAQIKDLQSEAEELKAEFNL